ncbi:hypothetical protein [Saccharopolyspora erythraea]|uniref:Peptide zinc metalloprotease protein n=2 Tax=Saccharopolyspora erythraea TaxID=1836 RepID=A4FE24_SACEN|nr:hypothetical protein [Saccharopolyspora erythraea]EQD82808.1 hypothetical protein N599_28685 [Saccharopolyspora erythraea D]QRK92580.1 hypothetical protein JQX30_15525 [Saccharopolyspora erythraea]CAM02299.1 hypothetical protein SACE_3021 [Saccharopolyspora erythraea NRRL 2338]
MAELPVPDLDPTVELIGEYQDSGYQEPPYLARRADGQVVQLTRLLYLVASRLDARRTHAQLAEEVSGEFGRGVSADQVAFLIDNRLRPAGMVASTSEAERAEVRSRRHPDRLLALRLRVALVPERVVSAIAAVFQPLYWPPVVVTALVALAFAEVWLFAAHGLGHAVSSVNALIDEPTQTLLVLGLLFVAGVFHEFGHVAACRYGGARPGAMGVGIYLVWPAMYSTVTDVYRLGRGARLRTDLGGVYFNGLALTAMIAAYAWTGAPWLLVAILTWQVTTIWQFLPSIRLDGYYILSDLVGVPDLFDRMMPTLRSLIPGRPMDPRVRELKPWARRVIAIWVVLVIPCLAYWLIVFLALAPYVLPTLWDSMARMGSGVAGAAQAGEIAAMTTGVIQILLLLLPWVGVSIILYGLTRSLVLWIRRLIARRRQSRDAAEA